MAAATTSNRIEQVFGGRRVVTALITGLSDGSTWDTGLRQILFASFSPVYALTSGDQMAFSTTSNGIITLEQVGTGTSHFAFVLGL